jgi:hypothetical protein
VIRTTHDDNDLEYSICRQGNDVNNRSNLLIEQEARTPQDCHGVRGGRLIVYLFNSCLRKEEKEDYPEALNKEERGLFDS